MVAAVTALAVPTMDEGITAAAKSEGVDVRLSKLKDMLGAKDGEMPNPKNEINLEHGMLVGANIPGIYEATVLEEILATESKEATEAVLAAEGASLTE